MRTRRLLARLAREFSASAPTASTKSSSKASSTTSASAASPPAAKWLGYLGALPFVAFSTPVVERFPVISSALDVPRSDLGKLQVGYGAAILSFLGGVHWGLAMTTLTPMRHTAERYLWSVCPSLLAFPTTALPVEHAAGIQAALISLVYLVRVALAWRRAGTPRLHAHSLRCVTLVLQVDRSWAKRGGLPPWYMKTLRGPLSLIAATGLVATASKAGEAEHQ